MGLLTHSTDYTDLDFDAARLRLQNLVASTFPEWTDFNVGSFGNILLELFAFVADVVTFQTDALARESRLLTATQRKNLIALCQLIGFRPAGAVAATADLRISLAAPPKADVRVPRGTRVRTASITTPISMQLLADVVIPAGASPPVAVGVVEHSEPHSELFAASLLPDQIIALSVAPYLDGSARVSAANGAYAEVPNFLGSAAGDRHFVVAIDQSDQATLRFGTGVSGALPAGTIQIDYLTGGGAGGNVNAGALVKLEGAVSDDEGSPVVATVTNPAPAAGGLDRQTMSQIRVLAPESLRVIQRTVAREDFEIVARRVPGVARALMLTRNEDDSIAENAGILFVLPAGGGLPSQAIKDAVMRKVTIDYPCTLTFQVAVQDPTYRPIDVAARIYLRASASPAAVRAAVLQALSRFFDAMDVDGTPNLSIDFGWYMRDEDASELGGSLPLSDVFNVVRDTDGVRKLEASSRGFLLNGEWADVPLGTREFPVLGAVELVNAATGAAL